MQERKPGAEARGIHALLKRYRDEKSGRSRYPILQTILMVILFIAVTLGLLFLSILALGFLSRHVHTAPGLLLPPGLPV